jgi:hypothetical protein
MRSVFDKTTRDELINRINSLNENCTAQWGKMNVSQMTRHCTIWEESILGKRTFKRVFIGRLFGKLALRTVLRNEAPLAKNTPTLPQLKIKDTNIDMASEKRKWVELIEQYEHFSNYGFVHSFFGKMTKEQIGYLSYKHTDHHLRQFNC